MQEVPLDSSVLERISTIIKIVVVVVWMPQGTDHLVLTQLAKCLGLWLT